jgi:sugar phosphate isomerase/epimerase
MIAITRRAFFKTITAAGIVAATSTPFAESPTRYKIIGFTKPFQDLGPEECAAAVEQIGWDGIECPVRPKGQIEPERAADELPKLIGALKKRGKDLAVLTSGIMSVTPEAERLLRLAHQLGIKRYRVGFINYTNKSPIEDQVREISAKLRDLAVLNKEIGITGGVQNHSGSEWFSCAVWDAWMAIKDLDPKFLGSFFDIAHATIEGGLSWPVEARLMEKYFMTVSVKDFIWEKTANGGKSKWVPLGDGLVSKKFFDWLKTTKFNGPISHHAEYELGSGKEMIAKLQKDVEVLKGWLA